MVAINRFPQLQRLAWNRRQDAKIPEEVALEMYERNWGLVDQEKMLPRERQLLDKLVATVGHGVLHV